MRDQELIKIMEVREKEMEKNLLQKAEAFRYLDKKHQKEIKATIQKRDEELESTLNYREKLWIEKIDTVNQNMVKTYQAQGELGRGKISSSSSTFEHKSGTSLTRVVVAQLKN